MITQKDVIAITQQSPLYPAEWKTYSDAPDKLYAVGNIRLLQTEKFAVVGARRTPTGALKTGGEIVKRLSDAFTIVTGCADGGDVAAIENALPSGRVICILAGGLGDMPQGNYELLEKVAKNGLLIALHPYHTQVRAYSYDYRNKYLAGLAKALLVLGAGAKSGALITAKYAKKQDKPIFALPYPPNTEVGAGCNKLIKEGGYLTENADDIFKALGITVPENKLGIDLTETEQKVLRAVRTLVKGHVVEIADESGVSVYKLQGVLSALDVKGLVANIGGNRYAPV